MSVHTPPHTGSPRTHYIRKTLPSGSIRCPPYVALRPLLCRTPLHPLRSCFPLHPLRSCFPLRPLLSCFPLRPLLSCFPLRPLLSCTPLHPLLSCLLRRGPVTAYEVDLEGIDSSGSGSSDIMEIIGRRLATRPTQEFILDNMMQGFLFSLFAQKW